MNSTKLWMTAQTPSGFGMPISASAFGTGSAMSATSGHAFGAAMTVTGACTATDRVVRERVAAVKGAGTAGLSLIQPYFPGTSAWRPPIC